ncbi:Carbonic anhydrase 2 [Geodia barretti]|nr:Carbonic anhydrase 2 [Geodia barretti]
MAVANDSEAIAGVWSALNVEEVQGTGGEFNTTVNFYDLLPSGRSYYYYEGSLTTPNCSEVVQWFLLEETISIPSAYLAQLREVEENEEGDRLTFNYRSTQDLAGRQVSRYPASPSPSPSPSPSSGVGLLPTISLLSMLLLAFHALL